MSIYSRMDRIVHDVETVKAELRALANNPQAQRTSVEGGAIDFNDSDGNLKMIVGQQPDGGNTITVVSGPTPPTPTVPLVTTDHGALIVRWDGGFVDALVAPSDWSRVEIHASQDPEFVPARETARGSVVAASGGEVTIGVLKGPWTVRLLAWSQAGKPSAPSEAVTVEVPGYGDVVLEEIDAAQTRIENARAILVDGQETLGAKLDESEAELSALRESLTNLDQTTLPALRSDLDAAEGRLTTAEGQITDAFGQLDAVPGQIDAAKQAAIDTAEADALAKAQAAEAAAKTHADLVAQGAEDAAITAAAADAKAKADAAQAAAIAAAQVKADAARDQAIADATGKIATARQEAIDTAMAEIDSVESSLTSAVNGKNKVTWSLSDPPVQYPGRVDDTWFKLTSFGSGGRTIGVWRWNGNVWVKHVVDGTTLANLDAGTINTGYLDVANRVRAGAITADKVLVGAGRNIIPWAQVLSGAGVAPHENTAFYGSGTLSVTPADATRGLPNHVVHDRTTADPGVDRYILQLKPAPFTGGASDRFAVSEGTWRFQIRAYTEVANLDAKIALVWYKADRSYGGAVTSNPTRLTSQPQALSVSMTLPPDAAYIIPFARTNQPGKTYWAEPELALAVGGTLIEPGGIQTPHLAADVMEVGNLKAGTAAIAEAVVAKIAAQTAAIQQADIKNLFVTGTSKLNDVVAEQIAADTARFIELEVGNLVAGTGTMDQATIQKLFAEVVVAGMAIAEQFIGSNALLDESVTAPKIVASEELWAKLGQFVTVRTEHMAADAIDGMVIRGATMESGDGRVRTDNNGLTVFNDAGDYSTHIGPDSRTFKGDSELESLVAMGPAEFRSTGNILAPGAKLTLGAGVGDPTAPPMVQPYREQVKTKLGTIGGDPTAPVGLAWDGTAFWTADRDDQGTKQARGRIYAQRLNPSTNIWSFVGGVIPESAPYSSEIFGVTCIGSELFWLGRNRYDGVVWVTDLNGTYVRHFPYAGLGFSTTNPLINRPAIGTDGTNVVIVQCNDVGILWLNTLDRTSGAAISVVGDPDDRTNSDLGGVYIGPADWGTSRAVIGKKSNNSFPAFSPTTGAYQGPEYSWAASGDIAGFCWDGTQFCSLDSQGTITKYPGPHMGDGAGDWWAAYQWASDETPDDSAITRWSRISPPARFTWPRRSRLRIIGSPLPLTVDFIGPALAKKSTTPVRTDFHQPTWWPTEGTPMAEYRNLPGDWQTATVPRDQNNYPDGTPSSIESANPLFQVKGDGSGRWGFMSVDTAGRVSGAHPSGSVPITPVANQTVSVTVTLPAGRFTTTPQILVSPNTSVMGTTVKACAMWDPTPTSFKIALLRTNDTVTWVDWVAIGG